MALSDDIALLSRVPLFAGLADDKLRLMAFGAERRKLVEGQTLFREGTSADCGFVVAYGAFQLTSTLRDGTTRDEGAAGSGTLLHPALSDPMAGLAFLVSAIALAGTGAFPLVFARLARRDAASKPPPGA